MNIHIYQSEELSVRGGNGFLKKPAPFHLIVSLPPNSQAHLLALERGGGESHLFPWQQPMLMVSTETVPEAEAGRGNKQKKSGPNVWGRIIVLWGTCSCFLPGDQAEC